VLWAEAKGKSCKEKRSLSRAGPEDGPERQRVDRGLAAARIAAREFRAPQPIRELQDLTRYRVSLVREINRVANRIQKVLEDNTGGGDLFQLSPARPRGFGTVGPSDPILSALCFQHPTNPSQSLIETEAIYSHTLTNPSSRNPFVFTSIQNHWGVTQRSDPACHLRGLSDEDSRRISTYTSSTETAGEHQRRKNENRHLIRLDQH
jgi:hypothetical protein